MAPHDWQSLRIVEQNDQEEIRLDEDGYVYRWSREGGFALCCPNPDCHNLLCLVDQLKYLPYSWDEPMAHRCGRCQKPRCVVCCPHIDRHDRL